MKINIKDIKVKSIFATLFISLFLSCNNGIEELQKENQSLRSISNLRQGFLDVFPSFGDSLGGILGFDTKTPESKVGDYFKKIQETVQGTKTALERIVADMKDKGNPNATAVGSEISKFVNGTLNKIIEGAKIVSEAIGNDTSELGNVDVNDAAGEAGAIKSLTDGIKKIVEIVLKEGKGNPEAGTKHRASDGDARTTGDGEAGKLFVSAAIANNNAKKTGVDAAKAVGAVTGADILQSIVTNGESIATNAAKANAKDGTIAEV